MLIALGALFFVMIVLDADVQVPTINHSFRHSFFDSFIHSRRVSLVSIGGHTNLPYHARMHTVHCSTSTVLRA